jgi:hypothetical protein
MKLRQHRRSGSEGAAIYARDLEKTQAWGITKLFEKHNLNDAVLHPSVWSISLLLRPTWLDFNSVCVQVSMNLQPDWRTRGKRLQSSSS